LTQERIHRRVGMGLKTERCPSKKKKKKAKSGWAKGILLLSNKGLEGYKQQREPGWRKRRPGGKGTMLVHGNKPGTHSFWKQREVTVQLVNFRPVKKR